MTYFSRNAILTALLTLAALSTALAKPAVVQPPAHPLQWDSRKFMHVSELRPGMRGYALTVFRGTKIEKFNVEILGVMAKFNEGKDYILFRALDGPPVTAGLNIAHGMSGSPIYIKGRLVGAISMGIPGTQFAKDPIALATPIEDMFDAWSPDLPSKMTMGGASADTGKGSAPLSQESYGMPGGNFQQIGLPLTVSGFSHQGIARMNQALSPYHFTVLAGGGGGASAASNPLAQGAKLVPGAAVGISLVQGDMDVTATGTVTYRAGNRVLLFGHPLANLGPIDAPLTTAYVVSIFPSYQDSVKLGSPIKTVGRIFQDRPFSVGGIVGPQPNMIPMTVAVNDLSLKRRKDFHVRIINHPLLTGQFVTQVADQAISEVHGQPGDSLATVTMDVNVEEVGHVRRTNTYYDATSIDQSAIGDLDSLMRLLSANPFYPLAVKSIQMGVTIQDRHDTAEIDHIFIKQQKFAPGDTVDVGVVLKPFKREPIIRTIPVKIPASVPDGTLALSVRGGSAEGGGGISLGGGLIILQPSAPVGSAGNVTQLVKQFEEKPRNNELVARLTLPTVAITVSGQKMPTPPPTLANALLATRSTGLRTERDEVKQVQETPYVVSGSQSLTITVQKKNLSDTGSRAPSAGGTPAGTVAPATTGTTTPPDTTSASADSGDDPDVTARVSQKSTSDELAAGLDTLATALPTRPATPTTPPTNGGTAASTPPVSGDGGAATTASSTPTPAPSDSTSTSAVKVVARQASVWRQGAAADFATGTLHNVSVTSLGDVRLAAALQKTAESHETYLWSLLPDGSGGLLAGTGDRGVVYRVAAGGAMTPLFRTGELEVSALARDEAGNVYAGTAPNGIVYKITPDGHGAKWFTAQEKYVTALAYDAARQRLYVASGGGTGRIYAVSTRTGQAAAEPWFTSPEAHILSLATDKAGNVYAGAAPDGIVYKITPDGKAHVLYDATEPNIAAVAVDSHGVVYAGTTPHGTIYKISTDGSVKSLGSTSAASGILSLRTDANDNVYACAGNAVFRITPDETAQSFVASTDEQFLTLAVDPQSSRVWAGTGTVGAVYTLGAPDADGLHGDFQSAVHDAGLAAHWGTLTWSADVPAGTHVTLMTRSGDVPRPDASWSTWSAAYTTASGQAITSPPARYLQYQAVLTSDSEAAAQGRIPRLRDVTVYYLPRNQAPTVKMTSPQGGDALSKTALVQWTANDPDHDTLTYELSYSADNGKTWTQIVKKALPRSPQAVRTTPSTSTTPKPVTNEEVAQGVAQVQADVNAHPEIPSAVRQQILSHAPEMVRQSLTQQRAQAARTSAAASTDSGAVRDTSFSWDTTTVPDGVYQLRVIASDRPSNPTDALTGKALSASFLVANTKPTLKLSAPSVGSGKTVTLRGTVKTGVAFVKAVQYRVDGGEVAAAAADDGLFDSTTEGFTLVTAPLTSGAHTVEIQALDRAGNLTTQTVPVTIK